jgi:hypothetical protein
MAKLGTAEWMAELPAGDEDLVDPNAGESVRWIPDKGWLKEV